MMPHFVNEQLRPEVRCQGWLWQSRALITVCVTPAPDFLAPPLERSLHHKCLNPLPGRHSWRQKTWMGSMGTCAQQGHMLSLGGADQWLPMDRFLLRCSFRPKILTHPESSDWIPSTNCPLVKGSGLVTNWCVQTSRWKFVEHRYWMVIPLPVLGSVTKQI